MSKEKKHQNITVVILACYLVPIFFLTIYGTHEKSWFLLGIGLFLAAVGSLVCYSLLAKLEIPSYVTPVKKVEEENTSLQDLLNAQVIELQQNIEDYQSDMQKLQKEYEQKTAEFEQNNADREEYELKIEELSHELSLYKNNSDEGLRKKDVLLSEYQETITQQRSVIKKKQSQIDELESKVSDLKYEVKTLVDVAKLNDPELESSSLGTQAHDIASNYQITPSPTSVTTTEEAAMQLKRCIDIAQKITGAGHFENVNSKFREWHMDNYALDLRRLFDNLRSETACTIFVFSQKDNKLLFVNNEAKSLLGWSAEKFMQNFPDIIQESSQEWNRGISRLATTLESSTRLFMKTRSGQSSLTNCHLGIIPSGIFRNYIIGILYPATQHNNART